MPGMQAAWSGEFKLYPTQRSPIGAGNPLVLRCFSHGSPGNKTGDFPVSWFSMDVFYWGLQKKNIEKPALIWIFLDEVNAMAQWCSGFGLESWWWHFFFNLWPRSSGMPSWEIELHEHRMSWDERWFHGVLLLCAMAAGYGPVAAMETELVGTAAPWFLVLDGVHNFPAQV